MGIMNLALSGYFKKKRESPLGKALIKAFEQSGQNNGSPAALKKAASVFTDYNMITGAAIFLPERAAEDFAVSTVGSSYANLFNAALDFALDSYTEQQHLEFFHENKDAVTYYGSYVDAIYPKFISSRPRTAANIDDVRVFQSKMYVLVATLEEYLIEKGQYRQSSDPLA